MKNQSIIEKLGFEATDKVVIFHIDDIGFSHASNVASFECLDFGIASCGAIITPAPWFLEVASIYKNNPKYDLGVHLTLTCEYELYRWRALSSTDPKTGLLDSENSLWRTSEEAIANVTPEAAEIELRSQIQMALDNGIDVTHIDTHMGTVIYPKFIRSYLNLAKEFKIPVFFPRVTREELSARGLKDYIKIYEKFLSIIESWGFPLIDHIIIDTGGEQPDKIDYYCKLIREIEPGLTHFLFHPAQMSSELKAITPDSANWRNQDYEAFTDKRIKECVEELDLKVIGYRELRDLIR
ncbi:MAG: polysaccharide deacetylase family protein [Candidatus Lokiarchaeota archaeon]|nr:polysaccharide deacetylase family protein [Candidatus Lokiarchaeota archaeon]